MVACTQQREVLFGTTQKAILFLMLNATQDSRNLANNLVVSVVLKKVRNKDRYRIHTCYEQDEKKEMI